MNALKPEKNHKVFLYNDIAKLKLKVFQENKFLT